MRVFVISLTSAVQRRAAIAAEFAHARLEFEFFDAIEGATLAPDAVAIDRHQFRLNTLRDPLPGELGCYASHVALWDRCCTLGEPLIILEDDVRLEPGFAAALQRLKELPRNLGYVRLESAARARTLTKRVRASAFSLFRLGSFELDYLSDVPLCMAGYFIQPATAHALIAASRTMIAPIDKFVQRTWEHEQPIFGLRPAVVSLRTDSVISCIGDRPRKSLSLLLRVQRLAYKMSGELRRLEFDRRQLHELDSRLRERDRPRPRGGDAETADEGMAR